MSPFSGPCHDISPVVFGAVCFVLIWWLSAFFRLYKYCKGSQGKNGGGGEPASNYVAVSNHLFKVDNTYATSAADKGGWRAPKKAVMRTIAKILLLIFECYFIQ